MKNIDSPWFIVEVRGKEFHANNIEGIFYNWKMSHVDFYSNIFYDSMNNCIKWLPCWGSSYRILDVYKDRTKNEKH